MQIDDSAIRNETSLNVNGSPEVILDGPLSEVYAKELQEKYMKKIDPESGIAIETQALDMAFSKSLFVAATTMNKNMLNGGETEGMLYGVTKNQASMSDVINVGDAISEMTDEQKEKSAIILDASQTGIDDNKLPIIEPEVVNPFEVQIQDIADENNVKIYSSLEAYISAMVRRK